MFQVDRKIWQNIDNCLDKKLKMNDSPDLNRYGYQVNTQLGCNREGGRITWKGQHLVTKNAVVIKQFCFATADSSWSGYKAYEREINILQQLDHPGIPKYLDGIETENGFCLIQEYISACRIDNYRPLTKAEIRQITQKLLEILVYLQQQNPPILHRDIKPENILLDDELKVYLIDFGFASFGSEEVSRSSVFKGTPGFIAPEQIIKPTLASDLYSLGVTIVCLLLNQNVAQIQAMGSTDDPYQLNLKLLLPDLERDFFRWLEKMTSAKASKRFKNASIAKDAFLSIDAPDSLSTQILGSELQISNTNKIKAIAGISAIFTLSNTTVWAINYVDRHAESSVVNIAIALIAGIVIGIAEFGAIEIAKIDKRSQLPGAILGLSVPIFLVGISALIWGKNEAIDIAATIVITQIWLLSYFWWQIPIAQVKNLKLKFGLWFAAVLMGIILGLNLI